VLEVAGDQRLRHLLEIELQAAGKHRHRNLLRVGGRQNEFDVLRRLFEGLQHGVEGRVREHVHFVDDIDLEAAAGRRIDGVLEQLPHLIDLGIGRRVDLEQVDETSRIDFLAAEQVPQGVAVTPVSQFSALARMRASVVLPTPRVPVNR
jgi:hypothetical protein